MLILVTALACSGGDEVVPNDGANMVQTENGPNGQPSPGGPSNNGQGASPNQGQPMGAGENAPNGQQMGSPSNNGQGAPSNHSSTRAAVYPSASGHRTG